VQVDDAGLFLFCGDFHDEPIRKAGRSFRDNLQRLFFDRNTEPENFNLESRKSGRDEFCYKSETLPERHICSGLTNQQPSV
jgi:hypothetical protein